MNKSRPCYYWDSSVFLMALKGEVCYGQDALDAARDILQEVENGKAVIIASEIIVAEILPAGNTPEVYDKWESYLQLENVLLRSVDHPVAIRAAKLRSDCLRKKPKVRIGIADACHVATFLMYSNEIDELHSFDADFEQALKYSGSSHTVSHPRRVQTTMERELFTEGENADSEALSVEDADDLGVGAEEVDAPVDIRSDPSSDVTTEL